LGDPDAIMAKDNSPIRRLAHFRPEENLDRQPLIRS
jgi:hypothetical protein